VFPGNQITDAWGNPITQTFQNNKIDTIQSPGGPAEPYDNAVPTNPLELDYATSGALVAGRVYFNNGNGNPLITVKVFYPDPTTGNIIYKYAQGHPGSNDEFYFCIGGIPVGYRAVRARIGNLNSGSANYDTHWFELSEAGEHNIELNINPGQ
jgi:hypothetical protein